MSRIKILTCIDCQYDFMEGGNLPVNGSTEKMDKLATYIMNNVDKYDYFVFSLDFHPVNHCSFKEFGGEWSMHCIGGSIGSSIYDPIMESIKYLYKSNKNVKFIYKGQNKDHEEYSAFECLKELEYGSVFDNADIDICGIVGEVCVANSVSDLEKYTDNSHINMLMDYTPCFDEQKFVPEFWEQHPNVVFEGFNK